ncbi:hypothetical protein D6R50_10860 [Aeromonas veronii]|uniref:Uncharacterized protein n=1 Tax=Aeromonas veronii TaxID=654 RepID=A0A3A9IDC0_AERVE|nr:hypothetical protein D6R50_19705 [Aeromonas veronii]RKJ88955.1 hypothetical protein D6R50_06575 [Aeromonas veronii]RKJ89729.1 hypothetical protein D6R50_10860 [Aeromonas veronii]
MIDVMITDGGILYDKIIYADPIQPNGELIFRSGQLSGKSAWGVLEVDPPEGVLRGGACHGAILPRLWEFSGHPTQLQILRTKMGGREHWEKCFRRG